MSHWAWAILFWVLTLAVIFAERECKGIITRRVISRVPPARLWATGFSAFNYRYALIGTVAFAASFFTPNFMHDMLWWGSQTVVVLDDWLFHDTDFKKKWDMVRNKIKWRMELPEPLTDQVAS